MSFSHRQLYLEVGHVALIGGARSCAQDLAAREAGKRRQKGAFSASFREAASVFKLGDTSNTGMRLRCGTAKRMTQVHCKKPLGTPGPLGPWPAALALSSHALTRGLASLWSLCRVRWVMEHPRAKAVWPGGPDRIRTLLCL